MLLVYCWKTDMGSPWVTGLERGSRRTSSSARRRRKSASSAKLKTKFPVPVRKARSRRQRPNVRFRLAPLDRLLHRPLPVGSLAFVASGTISRLRCELVPFSVSLLSPRLGSIGSSRPDRRQTSAAVGRPSLPRLQPHNRRCRFPRFRGCRGGATPCRFPCPWHQP